ncbi:hypothetical protein ABZY44_17660 [Streptomyces sp. NPDC006544]
MSPLEYSIGLFLVSISFVLMIATLILLAAYRPRRIRLPRHDRHAR